MKTYFSLLNFFQTYANFSFSRKFVENLINAKYVFINSTFQWIQILLKICIWNDLLFQIEGTISKTQSNSPEKCFFIENWMITFSCISYSLLTLFLRVYFRSRMYLLNTKSRRYRIKTFDVYLRKLNDWLVIELVVHGSICSKWKYFHLGHIQISNFKQIVDPI